VTERVSAALHNAGPLVVSQSGDNISPMRVLITTVGTRGDVEPYLALAIGLKAEGHEVTICTCPRFSALITERGIAHSHLDEGLLELLESGLGRSVFEDLNGFFGALRTIPKVIGRVGAINRRMIDDCWAAAEATGPDIIVYHPKMFCAPSFAALRNIPVVLAMLCPLHVPTGESPLFGPPLGRLYNRATYRFVHQMAKLGSRSYLRGWRAQHDPDRRTRSSGPTRATPGSFIPVIHGYSAAVCPPPKDWPDHASVTGYWFLPSDDNATQPWRPSEKLVEFLNSGPPPVYVGFGSIAGTDSVKTTRIVLSAIRKVNVRAVIATGWGGLEPIDESPSVHVLESAPHEWLFPKMAAVVHHGGAGTTAAGLRAGCPTVICPFGLDQPFWGRRVVKLGAGVASIPQKELTEDRLAEAIRCAVSDPAIRGSATQIAQSIAKEDGIGNAVSIIERVERSYAKRF
jgi:sterol 3beta-glucosyltransferase